VNRVRSIYRTPPMGEAAGEPYLNSAAESDVKCSPLELLDLLQALETRHGRKREARWGPRTLDLDLLLYGLEVFDHPRLILPHPGLWYRRFVLDPLAEIAPDVAHPIKRLTIEELRQQLLERPLPVGICGGMLTDRQQLAEALSANFSDLLAKPWRPEEADWPTLLLWRGTPTDQNLAFEDLPVVPRLDLTNFPEDPTTAARHVLSAALG
jgi:2-amino-4-hydroxy-6-hydroxymethyldihydropteridine diphosphokinase